MIDMDTDIIRPLEKGISSFATMWMKLVGIVLNEISQTEKDMFYVISLLWKLKKLHSVPFSHCHHCWSTQLGQREKQQRPVSPGLQKPFEHPPMQPECPRGKSAPPRGAVKRSPGRDWQGCQLNLLL